MKSEPAKKMRRAVLRMALTALAGTLGIVLCILFFIQGAYVCAIFSAFLGTMIVELIHYFLSDKRSSNIDADQTSEKGNEK